MAPSLPHVSIKARQPIDKLALPRELSALRAARSAARWSLVGDSTGLWFGWIGALTARWPAGAGQPGAECGLGSTCELERRPAFGIRPTDAARTTPGVCSKLFTTLKMSEQLFLVLSVFY